MHIRLILCQIDYKITLYKFTIIIGNIVHIVLYNSIFMYLLTRIVLQDQLNALLFLIEKSIIRIIKILKWVRTRDKRKYQYPQQSCWSQSPVSVRWHKWSHQHQKRRIVQLIMVRVRVIWWVGRRQPIIVPNYDASSTKASQQWPKHSRKLPKLL